MASVQLKNLSKTYPGGCRALSRLNLEINDGEFVVLVGPSGCGKSTTLRLIAGLEEVTQGEIIIGERLVNEMDPKDRDVAMVFQNGALYPHLTVYQNMAFGLSVYPRTAFEVSSQRPAVVVGRKNRPKETVLRRALRMGKMPKLEIDQRVREVAKVLSLEALLGRLPKTLSGGEQQRVALCRAIVRKPTLFLFDEPLSNLDAQLRVQMRTEISQLHHQFKTTTLYVTHDQAEAMTLGDRIVLLQEGRLQQVDTPIEVYRRPANLFAASFLGSPPMNRFAGEVHQGIFRLAAKSTNEADSNGCNALVVGDTISNGPVMLGIRPEDLLVHVSPQATEGEPFANVLIRIVEQLGHETLVHFDLAGGRHIARLAAKTPLSIKRGNRLSLMVRPGALHLFAKDQEGRRLN